MRRVNKFSLPAVLVFAFAGGLPLAAPVDAASVDSLRLRATYDVTANFSYATRAVSVHTTAHVTNPTASAVSTIAFNLATLHTGNANVGVVTVRGINANETISDQTVLVPISPALGAGSSADVVINYNATLAAKAGGYKWQFTRSAGVMTAYRWIPWLSRTTKFANAGGEATVTNSSTDVHVVISTDQALTIASSGQRTGLNGLTQTFDAHNVRDFNFSSAPDYQTAQRVTNGTTITFYYRTLPSATVLDRAAQAYNFYTNNVGDYPSNFVNIAEVGPWYGMESPNLFWIPRDAGGLLAYEVVHEMAHEWFYGVVGNNQALEPFADEALAEFLSREMAGTWTSSKCPGANLDRTVYTTPWDCYVGVVYYQGYKYLDAYRDHVGNTDFYQGLHNYYVANKFGIGGTRRLLDALDAAANYHPNHAARFPSLYP
ncbi:MAG TPA: hypothetical protein VM284_03680 [Candidatus Limnocylindria bacterium]|nr:hypothetical protein [Candidatus Limnocylindria bacterium]